MALQSFHHPVIDRLNVEKDYAIVNGKIVPEKSSDKADAHH
jgi:hypothetical protein